MSSGISLLARARDVSLVVASVAVTVVMARSLFWSKPTESVEPAPSTQARADSKPQQKTSEQAPPVAADPVEGRRPLARSRNADTGFVASAALPTEAELVQPEAVVDAGSASIEPTAPPPVEVAPPAAQPRRPARGLRPGWTDEPPPALDFEQFGPLDDATGTGQGVADPLDMADDCVIENGFSQGYSTAKGMFVVVGTAAFPCGPENPETFTDCRNTAFELAMLDAKQQIAEFLAAEIATCVKQLYIEPSQADPNIRAMGADRAYAMVNSSGAPEARKDLLSSNDFVSATSVTARQEVAGVQCFRSFESIKAGKGSVAVVAILSPKSIQMVKAMLGQAKEAPTGSVKTPISDWIQWLDTEGTLLYTHGVIQRTNESGELCLVAFGQASPRTESGPSMDAAYQKARAAAQGALRKYAGEFLACNVDTSFGYTLKEFADRTPELQSQSSFVREVEAVAAKLTLPGAIQKFKKKLNHPLGEGKPTAVVVMEWNVSASDASKELKATLDSMGGSAGGAGRAGMKQPAGSATTPPKRRPPSGDSGGKGGSGSSDDT